MASEARQAYFEDVHERAITARSAHNRPRRGGCTFPQHTEKEIREMSGPNYSVNLGKAISLDELKALPESLRNEYLSKLIDQFGAGPSEIAMVLGASKQTVQYHLSRWGFKFKPGKKKVDVDAIVKEYGVYEAPKMEVQAFSFTVEGPLDTAALGAKIEAFAAPGAHVRVSLVVEVVES